MLGGAAGSLLSWIFISLSKSLHNKMVKRVCGAPMNFFYSNPVGRILNRFSKDTANTDYLFTRFGLLFFGYFYMLLVFIVMSINAAPYFFFLLPMILLFMALLINASKVAIMDSLRYDSISRSKVNSLFVVALHSLTTIRAFKR